MVPQNPPTESIQPCTLWPPTFKVANFHTLAAKVRSVHIKFAPVLLHFSFCIFVAVFHFHSAKKKPKKKREKKSKRGKCTQEQLEEKRNAKQQ